MTTEKTIALTIQTSVGEVMSLLFITLSRFVITLLSNTYLFLLGCPFSDPLARERKLFRGLHLSVSVDISELLAFQL